jgi:hypothetical protein
VVSKLLPLLQLSVLEGFSGEAFRKEVGVKRVSIISVWPAALF